MPKNDIHLVKAAFHSQFKTAMERVGLEGKVTSTHAGGILKKQLEGLELYTMPVLDFIGKDRKRQTTRMKLVECGCQRKIRLSRKVLEEGDIICNNCKTVFVRKENEND